MRAHKSLSLPPRSHQIQIANIGCCQQTLDLRALPKWRYNLRQQMIPLIRWETPYLAWLQVKLRTPSLDTYFAITANLGTHTFFMVGLPICFWCGYAAFGKGYVEPLSCSFAKSQ